MQLQWGSKIRTCPDFEWSKVDQVSKGAVFKCHSNPGQAPSHALIHAQPGLLVNQNPNPAPAVQYMSALHYTAAEWSDFGSPLYIVFRHCCAMIILYVQIIRGLTNKLLIHWS